MIVSQSIYFNPFNPGGVPLGEFTSSSDEVLVFTNECEGGLNIADSSTVHLTGSGNTCYPLQASAIISQQPGNNLVAASDGLYASASGGGTSYNPANLNAATASLQNFSGSILSFTASINSAISGINTATSSLQAQISNVFASESNYTPLTSFNSLSQSYSTDSGSFLNKIANVFASESNYLLTTSYQTDSSSFLSKISNVLASESNYLPTSSFVNIGTISGSGNTNYFPYYSSSTSLTSSMMSQSANYIRMSTGLLAISGAGELIFDGGQNAPTLQVIRTISAGVSNFWLHSNGNGLIVNGNTGAVTLAAGPGGFFPVFQSNNVEAARIDTNGNMFVKTIYPYTAKTANLGSASLGWNAIYLSGSLYDIVGSSGSANQVLSSTATGIMWVNSSSGGGATYDPTNLNAATASLQQFSASILTFTSSMNTAISNINTGTASLQTQITNVFASESNYLQTSSISKTGINYVPYYSGSNLFTSSLIYQSGSGIGSVLLINPPSLTGSNAALVQIFGSTYQSGAIFDSSNSTGSVNQVLSSTGTGVKWVTTGSGAGSNYDPTNLNAASSSLQQFSASLLTFTSSISLSSLNTFTGSISLTSLNTFTGSIQTQVTNVFASESNYTPTSSFNTFSSSYYTDSQSFSARMDEPNILLYQALGSQIKAQNIPMDRVTTNAALASGIAIYSAIYLMESQTLTGVKTWMSVQGNYTSSANNCVGLYSYSSSSGVLTLVASSSGDSTSLWKAAANSLITQSFAQTYFANRGVYFIAALYHTSNQQTAPSLQAAANLGGASQAKVDFTNSAVIRGTFSNQTVLSSSISASLLASSNTNWWLAVY